MRHKMAGWLRRLADWLAPPVPSPVDRLMPAARAVVAEVQKTPHAGSIKWLLAMKALEKSSGAKRRHINAAIDRAVLELHGEA